MRIRLRIKKIKRIKNQSDVRQSDENKQKKFEFSTTSFRFRFDDVFYSIWKLNLNISFEQSFEAGSDDDDVDDLLFDFFINFDLAIVVDSISLSGRKLTFGISWKFGDLMRTKEDCKINWSILMFTLFTLCLLFFILHFGPVVAEQIEH